MKAAIKYIPALLIASAALLTGCSNDSPENLLASAKLRMQSADYKNATIELKGALQGAPDNITARLLLGQSLQMQGLWADSESELQKAKKLGASPEQYLPALAHALVKLGKHKELVELEAPKTGMGSQALSELLANKAISYMALGRSGEAAVAIETAEQALSRAGSKKITDDLMFAKAGLAFVNNQRGVALALLDEIQKRNPAYVEALYVKANLFAQENKTSDALEVYKQIVKTKPGEVAAHIAMADILIAKGAIAEAEKSILAVERVEPNNMLGKFSRARLEMRKGSQSDLRKANEAIQYVLRVQSNHTPSLALSAEINERLGNYEASYKAASKVLAVRQDHVQSALIVAKSYLRKGEAAAAFDVLQSIEKTNQKDPEVLTLLGKAKLSIGLYAEGLEYLGKASALKPESAEIALLQAQAYQAIGNTNNAITRLKYASGLRGEPGKADEMLINIYIVQKSYDKALQTIADYEKKRPQSPVVLNLRAVALLGKNERAEARKSLNKALQINPEFIAAVENLAHIDILEGNRNAAKTRFQAFLAGGKRKHDAMLALANLAATEKNGKDYIYWLGQAIKESPTDLTTRARLVEYYLATNNRNKALAEAGAAVNANPTSTTAYILLARVQGLAGDTERSISTYTQAVGMAPKSADAMMLLGIAQMNANILPAARASLERAEALGSKKRKLYEALVQLQVRQGNQSGALAYVNKIQSIEPHSPLGFDKEGELLLMLKRPGDALTPFQTALRMSPAPNRVIRLHQAFYQSGKVAEAEKLLKEWVGKYPKNVDLRFYQAQHYERVQRNPEAILAYEKIIEIDKNYLPALNNIAILLRDKDRKAALRYADMAIALAPGEANVLDTKALLLMDQGDLAQATKLFEESVHTAPSNPTFRYHLAMAYMAKGKAQAALEALKPALASTTAFPEKAEAQALYIRVGGK